MKKQSMKNILSSVMALTTAGFLASCASSGSDTPAAVLTPVSTSSGFGTTGIPTVSTGTGTNTVTLAASTGALSAMFFKSHPTNPTNIQFSMSAYNSGSGYAGNISITYADTTGSHSTTMSTTHPTYPSTTNAQYNVWLNSTQWHGFFQDVYGAVVVVIDGSSSTGDGAVGTLSGSVYFQNFASTAAPQGPLRMCWQIDPIGGASTTPYDCRTFLTSFSDGSMPDTTSSLYPNNAGQGRPLYTKLGTFDGLSQTAAFGN